MKITKRIKFTQDGIPYVEYKHPAGRLDKYYGVIKQCVKCNAKFFTRGNKNRYCSGKCSNSGENNPFHGKKHSKKTLRKRRTPCGANHPNWKGGVYFDKSMGYWFVSGRGKYRVKLSHIVVERELGRELTKKEVIHHINKIKHDDRIENLYLFPSNSSHITYHNLLDKPILVSNLISL